VRILAAGAVLTLGMGLLHTKPARPLLMALARVGGCPVASPEDTATARYAAIEATRGSTAAPKRPALGFNLDTATRADVKTWARARGVTCEEKQEGAELECRNVAATVLPESRSSNETYLQVTFGFHPNGHLQQVTTLTSRLSATEGSEQYSRSASALVSQLGTPMTGDPETSSAHLSSRPYATATVSYRYADYFATITAMSVPSGVVVREQYLSARRG